MDVPLLPSLTPQRLHQAALRTLRNLKQSETSRLKESEPCHLALLDEIIARIEEETDDYKLGDIEPLISRLEPLLPVLGIRTQPIRLDEIRPGEPGIPRGVHFVGGMTLIVHEPYKKALETTLWMLVPDKADPTHLFQKVKGPDIGDTRRCVVLAMQRWKRWVQAPAEPPGPAVGDTADASKPPDGEGATRAQGGEQKVDSKLTLRLWAIGFDEAGWWLFHQRPQKKNIRKPFIWEDRRKMGSTER